MVRKTSTSCPFPIDISLINCQLNSANTNHLEKLSLTLALWEVFNPLDVHTILSTFLGNCCYDGAKCLLVVLSAVVISTDL